MSNFLENRLPSYNGSAGSNSDLLAQSLAGIQQQMQEEEQWIQQMKDDTTEILQYQEQLKTEILHHHTVWLLPIYYTTCDETLKKSIEGKLSAVQDDFNKLKDELDAAGFENLDAAISQLLDGFKGIPLNKRVTNDPETEKLLQSDIDSINAMLEEIFQAMQYKVKEQGDDEEMDLGNITPDQLQSLILDSMKNEMEINNCLTPLDTNAEQSITSYSQDLTKAETDKNGIHWYNCMFGSGDADKAQDDKIISNADAMISLLVNVERAVSSVIGGTLPDFTQIMFTINTIIKKLLSILQDKNLSPDQKDAKLKSVAMELFVVVMGLLGIVNQLASKDKAQSDTTMSQANVQASQLSIITQQAAQKMLTEDEAYAQVMGIVMQVAQLTVGLAFSVMTGGISGVLMAALTVADSAASALTGKSLTERLADECGGGLVGSICASGIEMVATGLVGGILEKLAQMAMTLAKDAIMTTINASIKEAIEAGVQQAAEAIGKNSEEMIQAGLSTVTKLAERSADTAAKKAFDIFFRQNGMSLIAQALKKGVLLKGVETVGEMAAPAMQKAAQKAAEDTVNTMIYAMTTLEKVADFTPAELTVFGEIADDTADRAVSQTMKTTVKKASETSAQKTAVRCGLNGALVGLLYAAGQTNLVGEAVKKATGDNDNEALDIILQVLSQLMILVSTLLSGHFDYSMEGIVGVITKAGRGAATLGTGAQAYSNWQLYETHEDQATATTQLGQIQSGLDILNNMIQSTISNRQKQEGKLDSQNISTQFASTNMLAANLWTYGDTAARVLQA